MKSTRSHWSRLAVTKTQTAPNPADERKTSPAGTARLRRRPGPLNAGSFGADVASFELHLAAENKAAATIRIYTEAPRWFASAYLLPETDKTRWDQVDTQDVQRWVVWLLRHYTESYAYQQYRSLQQFFRWLAVEDEIADPMARLRAPKVSDKPVPFFSSVELSKLDEACQGIAFAQRRDAAILAVFRSTGIRLTEMAGIRYHPDDLDRGDVDLGRREIYVRGKGGKDRIVRIDPRRPADHRYLRARAKHPQAYHARLWLGAGDRGR